jgi:eukaryotic-like serine/threonine-protein kinase
MRFGRYQLVERIGTGGTAEVWRAAPRGPSGVAHSVIVKRLLPEHAKSPEFAAMLAAEARISAQLDHPAIVKVFELGEAAGEPYLAMELVDGWTLADALRLTAAHGRRWPVGVVCHVVAEIADALAYAHAACDEAGRPLDLVHRDVTPRNIMLTRQGAVKLVDFGTARVRDRRPEEVTCAGSLKGTPAYMSPEQADGRPLDWRSDVFSLGVVLFEGVTGQRLFRGVTPLDTLRRVREARVGPPSARAPGIDAELDAIALGMLAADPAERTVDLIAIAARLRAIARRHGADAAALREVLRGADRDVDDSVARARASRRRLPRRRTEPLAPSRSWRSWKVAAALTLALAAPYAIPRRAGASPSELVDHGAAITQRATPGAAQSPPSTSPHTRTPGTSRP